MYVYICVHKCMRAGIYMYSFDGFGVGIYTIIYDLHTRERVGVHAFTYDDWMCDLLRFMLSFASFSCFIAFLQIPKICVYVEACIYLYSHTCAHFVFTQVLTVCYSFSIEFP